MSKPNFTSRLLVLFALLVLAFSAGAQQFQSEISAYLQTVQTKWRLTDSDIAAWSVSDQYTNRQTGITYTYLQQEVNGIPLFNAVSTIALRDGKVVHFANRFQSDALSKANSATPAVLPGNAIQAAAAHLGAAPVATPVLQSEDAGRHRFIYNDCGIALRPVRVDLYYYPVENTLRLAWNVNIELRGGTDWWNIRIDAATGEYLGKNNWNVSCDFGAHADNGLAAGHAHAQATAENASTSGYNVFALPLEAPNFGPRSLLVDPQSTTASPYGWHDTNGADGAEYTITRGNNVYAYEDRNNSDVPGYSPDGGAGLNFDFPLDLALDPTANQDAIITNLFYVNNVVHDILYQHGFDEEAGNFQENNYGHGGAGNDFVNAEAQDGGGTNNANFSTPDDGSNGTMQMYLWPSGNPILLTVNSPSDIAGNYGALEAVFGPGITTTITADAVLVDDGVAPVTDACEPIVNGGALSGKIVFIDRGTCTFISKVQAAEAAGAIAVVVINNTGGAPIAMGGTGSTGIPAVMISQADGEILKAKIAAGETVNVKLGTDGAASADRDGSLDNGIVVHEYGHGLSNRLTGGPSNSNCLFNGEQGGEGWSDWLTLILTIEPGDAGADSRGIGTYALNDATGLGIRRYPYSTNMSINPQTYGDLAVSNEVHDIGEIWSQVLWDMSWKLIDLEGFDADWYNGTGGNNTALRLVVEAMKLQPCGPGYLDARDAILAADELLYNNAHRCLIWEAFAARGMGANAVQGSADIAGDESEDFTLPTFCLNAVVPPTAHFATNATTSCFGSFTFTDQSTDIPQSWLWDFGDGASSTAINPTHTYANTGNYTVTLVVANTLGSDTFSLDLTYATLPAPGLTGATSICAGGTVVLTADVLPGNTAIWTANGTPVYTGVTYTTPPVGVSTTYSVQQLEDKPLGHVGPLDNSFGGGGNHNTGFDGRLLFEAYAPLRILSVLVYAQGASNRTVRLFDENNNLVQSVTVFVPAGSSRITLNLDVPSAGLYSLSNVSENLYRNNGGASYPYVYDNLVRIYSSNATTNALAYYYYFYDWEVQETTCVGEAAEVTVNVLPGPTALFGFFSNNLTVTFADASAGNPNVWTWNFGDGSANDISQNPVHTYAAPGTYTVTLTVSDGNCTSTYTDILTVIDGSSGVNNPGEDFGFSVFPNPSAGHVSLVLEKSLGVNGILKITDAAGRVVLSGDIAPHVVQIPLDVSGLPAGVYHVRIESGTRALVKKLTILK